MLVRDMIARALRLNGLIGAGDDPDADTAADALIAANAMKAAWFGTLIGGRLTEQTASGAVGQAENGGEYAIPAAAFTLTAPGTPKSGSRFGAVDATLDFATHNLTVNPNGRQIEGATASLVISVNGDNRRWWYRGDTGNWVREAPWASASALIEFPDALTAYFPYMLALVIAPEFNTELRQDILAAASEGRQALARTYAPRGRNVVESPLGVPAPQPVQAA
jgi:hypothetical protein